MTKQKISLEKAISIAERVEKWEVSTIGIIHKYLGDEFHLPNYFKGDVGNLKIGLLYIPLHLGGFQGGYRLGVSRTDAEDTKICLYSSFWFGGKIGKLYKKIEKKIKKQ